MEYLKGLILAGIIAIMFLGGIVIGCARDVVVTSPQSLAALNSSPSGSAPVESAVTSSLYSAEVTPLTPVECGKCHGPIYNTIKERGTKHQIDCMECHKKYHIYHPGKIEYDQILPNCSDCHQEPHGKKIVKCFDCHAEAHAPAKITAGDLLNESCGSCHTKEGAEVKAKPSKHTDLDCFYCHSEHGLIPECMSCHESHTKEMTEADCLACHPAHMPLQVVYPVDAPQTTCSICHQKAYDDLQTNTTKHTALTCAKCHTEHRQIPQCESCHEKPHKSSIHKIYSKCGECHKKAHNLPVAAE